MIQSGDERPGLLARLLHGDPPATEPAEKFGRYGLVAAWVLGMIGLVAGVLPLIAPAGLLLSAIGVMLFTNYRGLRDRMRAREERSLSFRLTESRSATKFGGAVLTVIGLGWFGMGVWGLVGGQ